MKIPPAILRVIASYMCASYLFVPVFLVLVTDFNDGTIFGDIGISWVEFATVIAFSPCAMAVLLYKMPGITCWIVFLALGIGSWFVLGRWEGKHA